MKLRTFILLAVVSIGILSTSSCVKKYTCHCDLKYSGYPGLPDSSAVEFEIKDQKDAAKKLCKDESKTIEENGIKTIESCYLY